MTDKITIDSALLQQALDALDIVSLELGIDWLRPEFAEAGSTATALRAALAAPQPAQPAEPVSWHREPSDLTSCLQKLIDALYDNSDPVSVDAAEFLEKLYTTPPPAPA